MIWSPRRKKSPHLPTLYLVLTGEDGGRVEGLKEQLCWWDTNTRPSQLSESFQIYVKEQKASDPVQFSSLSRVWLFATPWTAARQASLSIANSRSLLRLVSIESVMPSKHLNFCHPLLLLLSIPPSIRVFSNESVLHIRWPKYWSFSFSISPSNEYSGHSGLNPTYNYAYPGTGAKPSQSLSCNRVTPAEF